jgi:hypothetical protein
MVYPEHCCTSDRAGGLLNTLNLALDVLYPVFGADDGRRSRDRRVAEAPKQITTSQ